MKITFRCNAACLAVLLLLTLAFPIFAQNNTLEVNCLDPAGNPAAGIKVQILQLSTKKWKDQKSDSKGIASFKKLDDGVYRILARQQGFAPAFYEFVGLKDSAQKSVSLKFKQGDMQAKVYFEDPALAQRAAGLLNQALPFLQEGKFEEATKPLLESLRINPSNPDANYNLAISYLQLKNLDAAVEPLKKFVEVVTAFSLLPGQGDQSGANSPLERAKQAQGILDKIPTLKLRVQAEASSSAKKFDEAVAKYEEALKIDPNDADLHYGLSLALANLRKLDEATASINKALQLKPNERDFVELQKRIAEIKENEVLLKARAILEEGDKLYQAGDYAGALKKYEEAQPMVPVKNQAGLVVQMGRTHARLKQPEEAVKDFNRAIELAPDVADHRKALAQFYLNEKKYDEALNVYADPRATGTTPPDQALFTLGQTLSNQGNGEVAELAFAKVLKLNPEHAEAYYELGMALYASSKDDKRTKELLTKYIQIGKNQGHLDNVNAVLVVVKKRSP